MKKYLQKAIILFLLCFSLVSNAQNFAVIGTGTGSNTSTGYPAPFGHWYWSSKHQMIYTAAELTAAGLAPGALINGLGLNVVAFNTSQATYQGFTVDVKTGATSAFTTNFESGLTNIYTGNYTPILGWNMFSIASPIVWNGTDNLIVGTCHPAVTAYTQNMSTQWSTTTTNQSIYEYNDNVTMCGATAINTLGFGGVSTNRPNLRISYIPPAGCIQPITLGASAITNSTATLTWANANSIPPISYDVELLLASGTATGTPTNPGVTGLSLPVTGLISATNYKFYVRANCSGSSISAWAGPYNFTTLPSCAQPTALTATGITYNSATLGWTDNNSTPPSLGWDIELGITGFVPTGTPVFSGVTNPYTVSGLPSTTSYSYYVRAHCTGPDYSFWSGPYTFFTPQYCPAVVSTTNDTFCAPKTATLGAVGGVQTTQVNWYDVPTGGTVLGNGNTFVTPVLTATDTFYAAVLGGGLVNANHLTTMAAGNGSSGNMFALKALTTLTIDSFSIHCSNPASTSTSWTISYATSDYLLTPGSNTNAAFWTTIGTATVPSAGPGLATTIPLPISIIIPAGQKYSFQIAATSGSVSYTNGTTTGALYNSNTDLEVYQGHGGLLNNMPNNPRVYNGVIYYSKGCPESARVPVYAVAQGTVTGTLAQATPLNASSTTGNASIMEIQNDGTTVIYYDASCNVICDITDDPGGNVLGAVTSTVNIDATVQTYNNQPYTRRWFDLVPTSQGAATIKLYQTQADFNDYNLFATANSWPLLPQNPTDAAGIANLRITKVTGGGFGVGTPTVLTPSSVIWDAVNMRWEISVAVSNFSTFHFHSLNPNNAALPVELVYFNVAKAGNEDIITWQTANEQNNAYFNVQRSNNAINFSNIGKVESKAPNGNSNIKLSYEMIDANPVQGHNYYRLEQVDLDGKKWYSQVLDIVWGDGGLISVYPNPTKDVVNVDIACQAAAEINIKIMDLSGRIVKNINAYTQVGMNNFKLDLHELSSGIYNIQVIENNKLRFVNKLRKD